MLFYNIIKKLSKSIFLISGERFGMISAKLALAFILMNFSVEKVPKTPASIVFDPKCITLFAKDGLPLKFKQLAAT